MRHLVTRSPVLALTPLLAGCGFGLQMLSLDTGSGDGGLLEYVNDSGTTGEDGGGDDGGGGGDGGGGTGDGGGGTGDGGGGSGDGGGGTGDGGGGSSAPSLSGVVASEGTGRIEVSFQASDADGDLEGGVLRLTVDGSTMNLDIPGDISDWRGSGTSTHYVDLDPCEAGSRKTFELQLFDASGLSSATQSTALTLSGTAINLTERGDAGTTDTENLGELAPGTVLCGNMDAASNNGTSYTGDLDFVKFSPTASGNRTFVLTWDAASGDYNMSLFNEAVTTWLADASTAGTTQPERFTYNGVAAQTYVLRIAGASGGTGDYIVTIE